MQSNWALPRWLSGKESTGQCRQCRRRGFDPWVWKIPQRRKWQPAPVFLPGRFHRRRSLVSYSPWGCKGVRYDLATEHYTICRRSYPGCSGGWQVLSAGSCQSCPPPAFCPQGFLPSFSVRKLSSTDLLYIPYQW